MVGLNESWASIGMTHEDYLIIIDLQDSLIKLGSTNLYLLFSVFLDLLLLFKTSIMNVGVLHTSYSISLGCIILQQDAWVKWGSSSSMTKCYRFIRFEFSTFAKMNILLMGVR